MLAKHWVELEQCGRNIKGDFKRTDQLKEYQNGITQYYTGGKSGTFLVFMQTGLGEKEKINRSRRKSTVLPRKMCS